MSSLFFLKLQKILFVVWYYLTTERVTRLDASVSYGHLVRMHRRRAGDAQQSTGLDQHLSKMVSF